MIKKIFTLVVFSILCLAPSAQAADRYNTSNNQLKIPQVLVGETVYTNVVITVQSIIEVNGGVQLNVFDTFSAQKNQLNIPIVLVGDVQYTNVVITVGEILEVGANITLADAIKPSTDYFKEAKNSFDDPFRYYSILSNGKVTKTNIAVNNFVAIDMDGDGTKELVLAMTKYEAIYGQYASEPCLNKILIFKLINGVQFKDISDSLIEGKNDLGGCTDSQVVKVDINNDGKIDILYSTNQENGRSYDLGSKMGGQLVGLISQSNGKYKIVKFGRELWYHGSGKGIDTDGRVFFAAGASGPNLKNDGVDITVKSGFKYLNGEMIESPMGTLPILSGTSFEFLSVNQSKFSNWLIKPAQAPNSTGVQGYRLSNANWEFINEITPDYTFIAYEKILNWGGTTTPLDVIKIGDKFYAGVQGGTTLENSCQIKINPQSDPIALFKLSRSIIPNYQPGKLIIESDLKFSAKIVGYKIENDKVVPVNLNIINEDEIRNYGWFECKDVNNDGYEDIVVYAMPDMTVISDASPAVYLNQKDGSFKRNIYDEKIIIKSDNPIDIITSYMDDIDGDGIMDIVILPGLTNTYRNLSGSMKFFKGLKRLQ